MSDPDDWFIDELVRKHLNKIQQKRVLIERRNLTARLEERRKASRKKTGPDKDRRINKFTEGLVKLAETEPVLVFHALKSKKDLVRLMHERLGFHSAGAADKFLTRSLPTLQKTIKDKLAAG